MIKKYRKKPVVIEALEFTRDNFEDVIRFTNGKVTDFRIPKHPSGLAMCVIPTLEGNHIAREGDLIIKGVHGEFYPCKPDIFAKTYEDAAIAPESLRIKSEWYWLAYDANPKIGNWHCRRCNCIPKSHQKEDFCPNCGADMRKEKDDE